MLEMCLFETSHSWSARRRRNVPSRSRCKRLADISPFLFEEQLFNSWCCTDYILVVSGRSLLWQVCQHAGDQTDRDFQLTPAALHSMGNFSGAHSRKCNTSGRSKSAICPPPSCLARRWIFANELLHEVFPWVKDVPRTLASFFLRGDHD